MVREQIPSFMVKALNNGKRVLMRVDKGCFNGCLTRGATGWIKKSRATCRRGEIMN